MMIDTRKLHALAEDSESQTYETDRGPVNGTDIAEHLAAVAYDIDEALTALRWSLTKIKDANRILRLDLQALMVLLREGGVGLPGLGLFGLAKLQSSGLQSAVEMISGLIPVYRKAQHEIRRARGAGDNKIKQALHRI